MDAKHGIILLSILGVAFGTSCSEAQRNSNLAQCLQDIEALGLDIDKFWFGTPYATDCPGGPFSSIDCANPRPQDTRRSVFGRLFPTGYTGSLDRYLKMVFTSAPVPYTACGNTFTFNTTWSREIDPLVEDPPVPNYHARHLPQLEWEANSTEMFTLIAHDIGYLYNHGVYINIQGNDLIGLIQSHPENIIKPYHGPLMTRTNKNPYSFMLFKQRGTVTVSQAWKDKLDSTAPASFDFNELVNDWNLEGPVAMNILTATGDPYGAQGMSAFLYMCPNFIAQSLDSHVRPFLPATPTLDVGVEVQFNVAPLDFTVCCSTHTYVQETFPLNPLGNPIYDSYRTSQTPTVTLKKKGFLQTATNFTGDMYTLVALDPDVPSSTVGTQAKPLLHWLVTNIPGGNVNSGTEYKSYNGPAPPDRKPHYYYFLLYKQDHTLSTGNLVSYSGFCSDRLAGRCLFDINRLVINENLTLVGASWMRSTTDIYVAKRKIDGGDDMHSWCTDMPGYRGDPSCPVGASSQTLGSLILVLAAIALTLFSY